MVGNPVSGYALNLLLSVLFSCFLDYSSGGSALDNSFIISSFRYSETKLDLYDWRYIRVDLPPWFSSMSMTLESDADFDEDSIRDVSSGKLPLVCFRNGGPPLPDVSQTSIKGLALDPLFNGSFRGMQGFENEEHCHPLQKNMTVKWTNEQVSPGALYVGVFNGFGPMRTQSLMISRGRAYHFSANIDVEGCTTSSMWGQYCNRTVDSLSCSQSDIFRHQNFLLGAEIYNQTAENVVSCRNSFGASCHRDGELKVYSLEVVGMAEMLTIVATDVRFNQTPSVNYTGNSSEIALMCYARHDAIPMASWHDYSSDISKAPLVIRLPKIGRWYIAVQPVNLSKALGVLQDGNSVVCYSLDWQVLECPAGKAGTNCTWEKYVLQTVLRKPSVPFESYYVPIDEKMPLESANFPLEPLLSNSSFGGKLDFAWTYFLLEIPHGASGGNIHVQLSSETNTDFEIYARFGGLPSLDRWDYYYANRTTSSNGSLFFKPYDSGKNNIDFYILYVREGNLNFGLRHAVLTDNTSRRHTTLTVSIERCPKQCSGRGKCQSVLDASGLTMYSYCSCDRRHGGFDCSVEIITHSAHIKQSIFLIASNVAAVFPAYWALRQKAFAEWVLFTSSGISSGLYHACDVGAWCALSFHVLQFMDFWLSFMAVVSTFVYLARIDEVSKRTIHTAVSILTALMAATGATRSSNIGLVIGIGAIGLLIGWLIEFATTLRSISCSLGFWLNILERWQSVKGWTRNLLNTLRRRFHWHFLIMGFIMLSMAAVSWSMENGENYWIWHSLWHITIYTSSFFFLCSKASDGNSDNQGNPERDYELTRQDSMPRDEQTGRRNEL